MYTDKDSNLISDFRTKYGEESVGSIRNWGNYNQENGRLQESQGFMLRCIKASITPVSCKLKNPLKTNKSYHTIHTTEKQLLYE